MVVREQRTDMAMREIEIEEARKRKSGMKRPERKAEAEFDDKRWHCYYCW